MTRLMKRCWTVCTALLFCGVAAADHSDRVGEETLTIYYAAYDHPPWMIQKEGAPDLGVTPEYIADLEHRAGNLDVVVKPVPFQRALVDLKEGRVDMIASSSHPSLEAFAEPVAEFGLLQMTLFTQKKIKSRSVEALPPMTVGYLRGLPILPSVDRADHLEVVRVNSEGSGFAAVDLGRLDGVIFAEVAYRYYAESMGWNYGHLNQALFLGSVPVYAWTQKGRSKEASFQRLAEVLQEMNADGSSNAYMTGVGVDFGH